MGDATDRQRLDRLAARQLGLFTRAQAAACGYSPYQVRRRVAAGEWRRVAGPVFTDGRREPGHTLRAAAAHLAVPGSVVAGPSAARWYGLAPSASVVYLWTPPGRHARLPGVRVFRGPLARIDVRRADGMSITSPGRTVFDCLRVLPDNEALDLLERARYQHWISLPELARRIRAHIGRRGAPRLARLMRTAAEGTRSAAERRAVALMSDARIRGWQVNAEIHDEAGLIGLGDIVFRAQRLVVELDGWAFHSDRDRFQHDRTRQNRLVRAGWTVLRFTWRDLTERPGAVVAEIRAVLDRLGRDRAAS